LSWPTATPKQKTTAADGKGALYAVLVLPAPLLGGSSYFIFLLCVPLGSVRSLLYSYALLGSLPSLGVLVCNV
jgi:hypothetical protein